ncbi:MAG: NAD(P)/FAD-dependent oxidoreductase [Candidatus Kariarchaeaceae archaeon]|jgi:nitrite reductase (NADH) large subunit
MTRIGIIGNGVAATTAINEIRKSSDEFEIEVFTDERWGYYPRPNLIEFIAGTRTVEEVVQYGPDWYDKHDIQIHLSSPITKIRTGDLGLETFGIDHGQFDRILVSAGSHPFLPPIQGQEKKGVHVLRTLDDAIDIKEAVKGAGREIVVGGGILGVELAVALKQVGGEPIIVSNIDTLMLVQLDAGASGVLLRKLEDMGITVVLNVSCNKVVGDISAAGVVSGRGDSIEGDLIVIATGVRPNTHLASTSGLAVKYAIEVDEYMETTVKGIYAAGDCMEYKGICHDIIPWAVSTSRIAAQNILKPKSASLVEFIPFNTLKVVGIDLTSIGFVHPESTEYESITQVDREGGKYFKGVIKDGKLVGGIAIGNKKVAKKLRMLVNTSSDVSDQKRTLFEVD